MSKKDTGGASVVADKHFTLLGEVRADSKKRIVLKGKVAKHYYAYQNDAGQILLEPMVMLPARQARRSKDPALLALLDKGILEAREGELHSLGSFAKYAKG